MNYGAKNKILKIIIFRSFIEIKIKVCYQKYRQLIVLIIFFNKKVVLEGILIKKIAENA